MLQAWEFFGSPTWIRTRDLRINSPSLYRLSYQGIDKIGMILSLATAVKDLLVTLVNELLKGLMADVIMSAFWTMVVVSIVCFNLICNILDCHFGRLRYGSNTQV